MIKSNFPDVLKGYPQWVAYRRIQRPGQSKPTKVPYNPRNGQAARSNDPVTWTTFQEASDAAHSYDGLGFMFSEEDKFIGVDLDGCVTNGVIEPWAQDIINRLDTYTEFSPSGTGVHLIGFGSLPVQGRKKGPIEMYDRLRFFTMTGDIVPGATTEIRNCQIELDRFHLELFGKKEAKTTKEERVGTKNTDDASVLDIAGRAKNGDLFHRLYAGNWKNDYSSQNEADLALINLLSFYCNGNQEQIDRIFRQSGLMRPKWDENHFAGGITYGQGSIDKALANRTEFYTSGLQVSIPEATQEDWEKLVGTIKTAQEEGNPDTEAEVMQEAARLLAAMSEPKRTTRRNWLAKKTGYGLRHWQKLEKENATTLTKPETLATNAVDQILWEGEPEKVFRPVAILNQESLIIAFLPISEGGRSTDLPHVVTESGELLTIEQAEARGIQIELSDTVPARWSKGGVRRYVVEGNRPDGKSLLEEVCNIFDYYVGFASVPPLTNQRIATAAALSVLLSYFTEAFPAIGYIHFHGPKGSGKSKCQQLHAKMAFNGEWVVETTTLAAIRRMAAAGGVLGIDDSEKLSAKDDKERYSLLLSGYKAGAVFHLVEEDGSGIKRTKAIPVYGMRTFSAIREMDDTLRSRLVPFPLVKTNGPQANRSWDVGISPFRSFTEIADDAFAFALPRLKEARHMYAQLAAKSNIAGRDFEIIGPFLTVAHLIGGWELANEVKATLLGLLALREEQGGDAAEIPVLRSLIRIIGSHAQPVRVTPSQVSQDIQRNDLENAFYIDQNEHQRERFPANVVGRILRGLGVGISSRNGSSRYITIQPQLLKERLTAFLPGEIDEAEGVETPSPTTQASLPSFGRDVASSVSSAESDGNDASFQTIQPKS